MKKFIILLLIFNVYAANAQNFMGKWIIPVIDEFGINGTYEISFNSNNITSNGLTGIFPPESRPEMAAGGYQIDYALNFYILGSSFFYDDQEIVWNHQGTITISEFNPEFQIINRPGYFDHYYTFYSGTEANKDLLRDLCYNEIWYNDGWHFSVHNGILGGIRTNTYIAFAITDVEDGTGRFYAATAETPLVTAGLRQWTLTGNGINANEAVTLEDENDPNFIQGDFYAYNMEVKTNDDGSDVIAWISAGVISNDKVFIYRNGNGYIYDLNHGRIGGIEFSTYDENILYVSCPDLGIIALNYLNGNIVSQVTGDTVYGRTYLQTAPDGNIYAVSNDGMFLGRINQVNGNFEPEVFSLPYPLIWASIVSTYETFDGLKYYILPENSRVYHPVQLSLEQTEYIQCPDGDNGEVTATVTGGTGNYTYTWEIWNGSSWTLLTQFTSYIATNLSEGTYRCCATDDEENTVCQTIDVIVNPNLFTYSGDFHVYNSTQTISGQNYSYESGLKVTSNAVLTLNNCTFQFGKFAKVIIEPGSKLIMNNTVFTNLEVCGDMWQGVEVWGNKNYSQLDKPQHQGKLTMNHSAITNALIAVNLSNPANGNQNNGGIVQAEYTSFTNNTRALLTSKYENIVNGHIFDNVSNFKYCNFVLDEAYLADQVFYKHIDMGQTDGIKFWACSFSLDNNGPGISQWNQAIQSHDAGFDVLGVCETSPCIHGDQSTFNGFHWGIYAINNGLNNYTFRVETSKFSDNDIGVCANSINYLSVLFSDFEVGYNAADKEACEGEGKDASGIGIDLNYCTGFAIEQNSFSKFEGALTGTYTGIRCKDSNTDYDIIYKNNFNGLSYGNFAEGMNRHNPNLDQDGLEFQCNTNTLNNVDFIVTGGLSPQIRTFQGTQHLEAGNSFSTGVQLPDGNFRNEGTQVVDYFYHTNPPVHYTTNYVVPIYTAGINTCPSHYGGGGGGGSERGLVLSPEQKLQAEQDFATNLSDYNNVNALYENLKDGGNTTATLADIVTSWPNNMWELRAELLGKSPHLSKEVLMAAADKTDVLPESVLFEILSANPDELRKEELISYLENKDQPLPEYLISILKQLAGGITYKTILLQDMARYKAAKTQAAYDLIRSSLNDTVTDYQYIRNWLDNLDNMNADLQIVSTYLAEADYSSAQTMLDIIPGIYNLEGNAQEEYNDYKSFMEMQMQWQQQGHDIFGLDSLDMATLVGYAENSPGKASLMAQGILESAYGYHFCNCLPVSDSSAWKSSAVSKIPVEKDNGLFIEATPNPASSWVAFDYKLPSYAGDAILEITDIKGSIISTFSLTNKCEQQVWDIRGIDKGVYLYTLKVGATIKSGKLIIK